jgi:O-antigen/teichoic acid export membrane protein
LLGLGVYSLVLSGVVSMLVTGTMIAVQLRWVPGVPRLRPVRRLLSYAGFTTVNNLIGTSSSRIDNMLVGAFLGSAPLGLYNRAYSLARIPSDQFAESIGPLLLGSLSRVQEDHDESRRLYFKALSAISALTWPFLVILAVLGPTAVIWLYGDAWADVGVPLQVMIPGVFGLVVSLTLKGVINAQGLVRQLLVINVLVAVVTVLVVVLLAPFGLMAIAVGITLREYLMLWLMHRVVRRSALQIRFPEIVATVWPALAASAAALLAGGALEAAWMAEGAWAVFLKLASVSTLIFIVYAAVMLSLYRLVPGHESLGSTMRLVLEGLGGVVKAVSGLVQPRRKTNPEPSSD